MQDDKRKKKIRIVLAALGGVAAVLLVLWSMYMVWERPPVIETPAPSPSPTTAPEPSPTMEPMPEGLAYDTARQDGVYTVLLVGGDQISGNTDTILVGKIDTKKHEMNFVSIPRDTIINVDWDVRKLNSVYAGSLNNGGTGVDSLTMHIRWLLGFDVDCYGVVDLTTFVDVIDAMGGIYFDVPFAMDYDDYNQELFIHLEPGYQLLNGYQCMCLCRYRANYVTGDLGRIEMQQAFLRAAAQQFISLGNIPNAKPLATVLANSLNTNLTAANIAYFMRQALLCKSEDVHFYTMPCDQSMLQGYSYAVPRLGQWLETVNQYLNPYESPVTAGNVNVVYRNGANYAATGGLQGAWYYEDPGPEPIVTPTPTQAPQGDGPTIIQVTPKPPETMPPLMPPETEAPATPTPTAEPTPEPPSAPPQPTAAADETPDFALRLAG